MSKSLVSKATSDDAKEPTGFQLKELAQHSYDSLSACTEMAELLLKKLDKESADVKYKALKCIKYVCLHGRGEFRMDVQKEAATIKQALRQSTTQQQQQHCSSEPETQCDRVQCASKRAKQRSVLMICVFTSVCLCACLDFKGPPDPLRGDAPFQRVRDEAKECINAVFNGPATRSSGGGGGASGKMEGYGGGGGDHATGSLGGYEGTYSDSRQQHFPSSSSAPAYAHPNINDPVTSSGKMVGFGNPQYDNAKSSASFIDKMKHKMHDVRGGGPSGPGASAAGPYRPYAANSGTYNSSTFTPPPIATLDTSNGAGRKRGEVGGVWASGGGGGGGSFQPHSNTTNGNSGGGGGSAGGYAPRAVRPTSSNGEYETRLIDSLTPAAGVRSVPSKEELSKFALQCESLDKLLVVRLINEQKLVGGVHPASQMKALCLVECILTTGDASATEEVDDYLCDNAAQLEALENQGATPQLRNKAVRVMELCGLREEKRNAPPAHTAAPVGAATNFYQQQQQQPQQPAKDIDLFGFTPAPSSIPTPAPSLASASSAFGFLGEDSSSPSGNGSSADMFGSLEVKAASSSPLQGAPITLAISAQQQHDPFDMFAAAQPQQPAQQQQQQQQRASPPATNNSDSLAFLSSPTPLPSSSSSSAGKVDPLTLLMSTTRISQHPQPRAPFQQQQPQQMQQPQQQMQQPFGPNGMAGFPPRGNNMPPLGPPQQQQYQQQQLGGFQQQAYPQQGYPQQQQQQGYGQQQQQQQQRNAQANQNLLFQVKAAGSNQSLSSGLGGHGSLASHMRPSIELDASGNPVVLGGASGSGLGGAGGAANSAGAGTLPGSSAFGFVAAAADSFGFVNDILASTSGKQ